MALQAAQKHGIVKAANILSIHRTTIWRWKKHGIDPAARKRHCKLFHACETPLRAFFAANPFSSLQDAKEAVVAYGSAGPKMRPTGKGEVAVPTTGTFTACRRVFRNGATSVVDEAFTTAVDWATGGRKELVYRVPALLANGELTERLAHCHGPRPPVVAAADRPAVEAYLQRKKVQDKQRRGGPKPGSLAGEGQPLLPPPQGAVALPRYPEVRGPRFVPETRMYRARDKSSALAIARLRCMELLGRPRPAPFCRAM